MPCLYLGVQGVTAHSFEGRGDEHAATVAPAVRHTQLEAAGRPDGDEQLQAQEPLNDAH